MIYVVRIIKENGETKLANSKPCEQCIQKLRLIGVKKIAYSVSDGIVIENISKIKNRPSSGTNFLNK